MAKMSFSDKPAQAATGEPATEVATEVVDENGKALVPTAAGPITDYVEDDDMVGEDLGRYVRHPYLNILSKNSKEALLEAHGLGAWIINETKIGKMDTPLRIIVIKAAMAWQEQLAYGSGVRGRIFKTAQECHAAGLSTDWEARKAKRPSAAEVLNFIMWIPNPEGVDAPHIFLEEGPEGAGCIAKFFAARTAFGTVGKDIITAQQKWLRKEKGGLVSGLWDLTAAKEPGPNNSTYLLPHIKPMGRTSEPLIAFLRELTK